MSICNKVVTPSINDLLRFSKCISTYYIYSCAPDRVIAAISRRQKYAKNAKWIIILENTA